MYVISKVCKSISDSGKDEFRKVEKKYKHEFRLLDDDNIIYFYGFSNDDSSFAPLDEYGEAYGCTSIQYKNTDTKEWEYL